jgi:hypothetical protein
MSRLKAYLHIAVSQLGLAYIALWAVTFAVLDYGPHVFAGACRPVGSQLLFSWSCDAGSPSLAFVAAVANAALSVTVWAPVYVAAATVRPDALMLAFPILLVHLIGLPAALLVSIRMLARVVQMPRWLGRRRAANPGEMQPPLRILAPAPPSAPRIKPRNTFGLRGQNAGR